MNYIISPQTRRSAQSLVFAADLQEPSMELQTQRLRIVLQSPEEVEKTIGAMSDYEKSQISPDWLARMRAAKVASPWTHAFSVVQRDTDSIVGTCGFKGPPVDGIVEIAYSINPEHEGKGYATEAAQALTDYASSREDVCLVRAHTLPGGTASKRVLVKCGFRYVGETVDPEDGTVSRFEWMAGDPDSRTRGAQFSRQASVSMQTIYEAVGGREGLLRLASAWHARVMADEVVSHAFSHGYHPQHTERLAAYWAEALGGPTTYSERYGDETSVVRTHSGNGPHEEMDQRAIACFDQALDDIGLARDERLWTVLHEYFAWATTTTMARYHRSADDVPDGLNIPKWSWHGLVSGAVVPPNK